MRKIFKIYQIALFSLIVLLIASFYACEKVIIVDVKNNSNRLVVQANVTNTPGPYTVQLSASVKYYDSNTFPAITGAQVSITGNDGQSETLLETTGGIYQTKNLLAAPGKSYSLNILSGGQTYTAAEIMPYPVSMDSLSLLTTNGGGFGPGGPNQQSSYRVTCFFTDPQGFGNYYRVVITSNDTAAINTGRNSRILSDKLADGGQRSVTFRNRFVIGDTVTISLQSIPRSTYDFFNTLANAEGEVGAGQFLSSLPANPTNNISNKGLGYFAVYSETKRFIVIK